MLIAECPAPRPRSPQAPSESPNAEGAQKQIICNTNVADFPTLKESLKLEEIPEEGEFPLHLQGASRHILKKIPITFKGKNLGTLYLRASTPKHCLTHREEYFLGALGRITAIAILNVQRFMVLEKIIELPDLNVKSGE